MDFLNGFNATILCYGQTGAGKTFTMFGNQMDLHEQYASSKLDSTIGIIPRASIEVLDAVKMKRQRGLLSVSLSVSYVEIYGDQARHYDCPQKNFLNVY